MNANCDTCTHSDGGSCYAPGGFYYHNYTAGDTDCDGYYPAPCAMCQFVTPDKNHCELCRDLIFGAPMRCDDARANTGGCGFWGKLFCRNHNLYKKEE